MDNCVICGKPGVMFRESGYVCEYHGSMCDRGYDLADIVDKEKEDAEIAAIQAFHKSIGWGEPAAELAPAQPAPAGDGETWGTNPTQRELESYGDGYTAGMLDGPEYAPLMNEIAALREQLAAAQAALNNAEGVLYSVGQRLPMTDSYKDVNANRIELRKLAQDYFTTTKALKATSGGEGGE